MEGGKFFFEDRREDLVQYMPDHMWLVPKRESTDGQDRLELRAYEGFPQKRP